MLHDNARLRRRRPVILLAGLVLLVAIVLAAVHTSPFRAYALRYVARAALSLGVRIEARRLDYNLLTLHVGVVGVTVSAVGEDQPFLEAEEIAVALPIRVLSGEVAFDEITIQQGAVHIVRRTDGTTNLPRSTRSSQGEPASLPIRRLFAPRLAVDYRDEGSGVDIRVPSLTLDLSAQGRLAIDAPLDITVGSQKTAVTALESDVVFDGRDLRLLDLRIEAPEARARVEGTLRIIRRQPAVDVRVNADTDLSRAAKWWGQSASAPSGAVHVEGTVGGPFTAPSADVKLSSDRVEWSAVDVGRLSAQLHLDTDGVEVSESRFDVAAGQVAAVGSLAWQSGDARINLSWREVDVAQLLAALTDVDTLPSGRASGVITASGPIRALQNWDLDGRLDLARGTTARGRVSAPGETRLHLADGRWRLEAQHVVSGVTPVRASLTGLLRGSDLVASTVSGVVSASPSDLQALVNGLSTSGVVPIPDDMISGSMSAEADVGGTLGRPVVMLLARSDRATVAGQELVNLRARGTLTGSTFAVDELSAEQPPSGEDDRNRGRVQISGDYDLTRRRYTATVTAGRWRITPAPGMPLSGVVGLEYSGEGRGRLAFGKGRVVSTLAVQGLELGEVVSDIDLAGDVAHITARAPDFDAVVDADVQLNAPYVTSLRANAPAIDLARATRDITLMTAITGSANVRLEAEGPLEGWKDGRASVEVASLDGRVDALPVRLRESARLRYEAGRLFVERLEASAGETSLSASGALPISIDVPPNTSVSDSLVVTLMGTVGEVADVVNAVGSATSRRDPFIVGGDGPVTVLARISGTASAPVWAADLEMGPSTVRVRADLPPLVDLRVRGHVENGLLEVRDVTGAYQEARLTARGQAPLALLTGSDPAPGAGDAVLQARVTGLTSAALAPFVDSATLAQIGGSLDATLDLRAPALNLDDVRGELVLERLDLLVADLPVRQRRPTRVVAGDGFARIETWDWEGEGTSLEVRGAVHLSDQQAAILATGALDARLMTAFLRDAGISTAGRLEPRLSITGPLAAPTINGDVHLLDGEVRIRQPRIVVGDLDVRAVLARGQAYVTSLSGTVNGGALTGSGLLDYAPDLKGRFTADVRGMALEFPEGLRSEVDAALELTTTTGAGQATPSGRLSGTVTVHRGSYREPLALVTGLLANLQRSATTVAGTPRSSPLDQLALDVRVVTDEDLVIQNNVARAQLGADLRVIGVASAPALSGRAELREGGQLFLGRNTYTVESGTIDFANPVTIEPILGISATTRAGGEDIQIKISGTPDTLTTDLSSSSDPGLGQADISSLLLTGRPLNELSSQQASVVGAQVLGNLSGDVLGFAGRAVGLDTLRVGGVDTTTSIRDPADLASEVDPTSRLTFGKSLGSQIDVTVSQSLDDGGAQTWIIDYLPVRRIALRLVSDDDDLRSYEFRHDLTFGGVPRAIQSGDVSRTLEPPRVSAVRILGESGFPEQQIRQELRLREGTRFDFITWQDDRDRLERFYHRQRRLEARIDPSRRDVPAGVELAYELSAGPETVVRTSGVSLAHGTIEEIETVWAQSVFDGFLIEEVEGIVRRELARDGTYQPTVTVRLVNEGPMRALVINVVPGSRAEQVDIALEGVEDPLRSELLEAVGDRASAQSALTSPADYERTLVEALLARGHLTASVKVGAPSLAGTTVSVPVSVNAGPQFTVGGVAFEGASGLSIEELRPEVALDQGAVYRAADVEQARGRLQSQHRREGYVGAAVEVRQQVRSADAAVDLTFVVKEGPRQIVGEVTVSGNRSVDEDVVLRALRLQVGDPLRTLDWLEARRRLFETGLFRRVDIAFEPIEDASVTSPMRLRVLVEEWPALRVRYGLQVAEERPEEEVNGRDLAPGVSVDATRRTLFGRAITIGGAAQYQQWERLGRVFLSTPTLFGWPLQSSLVLERAREEEKAFTLVTDRTTLSWEQRARRGPFSLSYGLRIERNHTYDTAAPIDSDFPAFDLTVRVARLTGTGTWDTRDDPADATRGTFASTSVEHASDALGSDLLFVRSLSQAYHFQPWKSVVLASAGRVGVVQALGGQDLIPGERFFAGGARTVRGVPEDSLGIRDVQGIPIGGKALLTFNQEVRFPIYKWFRGVAFVDAGNVFATPGDMDLGALVVSSGVGLRVSTPFVLLRFDYGKTLWNAPTESGRWVFGLGQSF